MKKVLTYLIDGDYLETRGDGLVILLKDWLAHNNIDAVVSSLTLDKFGSLNIDYSFDNAGDKERIKKLSEQLLKRFNITYEIEED